jgi:hypothetical protein
MDYKSLIIDELQTLLKKESLSKMYYKVRAYDKVLKQIKLKEHVYNIKELENVKGIGKKIKLKLE